MKQEDQEILLIAYKKVHEKFERDKWDLIKKTMEDDGADNSYTVRLHPYIRQVWKCV